MSVWARLSGSLFTLLVLIALASSSSCIAVNDRPTQPNNPLEQPKLAPNRADTTVPIQEAPLNPVILEPQITEAKEEALMTQITVQISIEVAQALHQQAPATPESVELLEIVQKLGVELVPMHPGANDPLLLPFFTIAVLDEVTADRVIADIQQSKAVEGAYIEPPAALP